MNFTLPFAQGAKVAVAVVVVVCTRNQVDEASASFLEEKESELGLKRADLSKAGPCSAALTFFTSALPAAAALKSKLGESERERRRKK